MMPPDGLAAGQVYRNVHSGEVVTLLGVEPKDDNEDYNDDYPVSVMSAASLTRMQASDLRTSAWQYVPKPADAALATALGAWRRLRDDVVRGEAVPSDLHEMTQWLINLTPRYWRPDEVYFTMRCEYHALVRRGHLPALPRAADGSVVYPFTLPPREVAP